MSAASGAARRAGGEKTARQKPGTIKVEIVDRAGDWSSLGPVATRVRKAAEAAYKAARAEVTSDGGAVVIALSDAAEVQALNAAYRGNDKPTNVLSFPVAESIRASHPSSPLGDVILSFETVVAEADQRGLSVVDHLQHLVVHGILHLLGYDHETDADAVRMERLESQVMLSLGVSDPYVVD
jgi:probable rRNA maturation factor